MGCGKRLAAPGQPSITCRKSQVVFGSVAMGHVGPVRNGFISTSRGFVGYRFAAKLRDMHRAFANRRPEANL